ncbi:DinB family protein [Blastopirellula sp. JC732]|uniref:DinB family protein n=1 Tax=Blastopirellula sediminis TaxID=2894196 RepID=A0A9X1MQZ7_9BACT|nr:DinB family protein [Blastopirellula sediminis]MCC9605574.1 DinB family protein [Blastopirellula sediminis]MCC9631126.1 DinB family protein [Blastopirellula sediminis]
MPTTLAPVPPKHEEFSIEELIDAYEKGSSEIRAAIAGMTEEEIAAKPVDDMWSTLEVVCHLADCEQFYADRMKRTAATDRPELIEVDGFRYNDAMDYQHHDLEEELLLIEATRRQMARTLRLLPRDAWNREATLSELGTLTLRHLVLHAINHVHHHLEHVKENRKALR